MHPFAVKRSESEPELGTRGVGVPLTPTSISSYFWTGEISIGTPPQTLKGKISLCHSDEYFH
jgi:hypothetical protein